MAFWAAIPMVASMASSALGQQQATEGGIEGAKSSARIQQMNREYQKNVFEKNIEMQKPFYEAGLEAIEPFSEAIAGRGDAMKGGLAQMQKDMIEKDTGSMSDYVKNLSMGRLEAEEGEKYKGRLMDLQQIGLGASGSAGKSAINLGTSLAKSYAGEGLTNLQSSMNKQTSLSNMWTQTMDQLSGLPAYYAASNSGKSGNTQQSTGSVQPYTTPTTQTQAPFVY